MYGGNIRSYTYIYNLKNGIYDDRWLMNCIIAAIHDSCSRCEREYTTMHVYVRFRERYMK